MQLWPPPGWRGRDLATRSSVRRFLLPAPCPGVAVASHQALLPIFMSMSRPDGRLERIWLKRAHRGPMDSTSRAVLVANQGIRGNVNYTGRRQITIISLERWREVTDELGADVDPSARRRRCPAATPPRLHSSRRREPAVRYS